MKLNKSTILKGVGTTLAGFILSGCVDSTKLNIDNVINNPIKRDAFHLQKIKEEMGDYHGSRGIRATRNDVKTLKNITNKELYGYKLEKNISGSFIQEGLSGIYPETIENKKPQIFIEKYNGKNVLRFYFGGKLEVVWYVSVGKNGRTPNGSFLNRGLTDKYHTSSNSEYRGAVMPYAIHVVGGIRIHGSTGIINGHPRSHGCVRTPLFPVKHIYDLLSENGSTDIKINIKNIY